MTSMDAGALSARLSELAAEHGVVGASVAVLQGTEVVTAATGIANVRTGQPVSTETVFQIGSITKAFTATLVLRLVDEGLADLDEPIRSYLPEFRVRDEAATGVITPRQLLSHTSGIDGDLFDDFGRGDDCIERYVAAMRELAQTSPPGAFFSYCNAGYTLLGRLVERLRGETWDAALRKHLLQPLGAADTLTLPEEAILRSAAVGHLPTGADRAPEVAPLWHLTRATSPAGVILATAADLLTFVRMHLDDGRATDGTQVLSPASVKAMRELQVRLPEAHTLGEGWGLGWILYKLEGPAVIGHDGATVGQQAYLRIVPDYDLAVAVLMNGGVAPGALFDDLVRPLLRTHTGAELVASASPPDPPLDIDVTPFLGVYERVGVRLEVRDDDGQVVLQVTSTGPLADVLPDEPPKKVVPLNDTAMITAAPEDRLGKHVVLQFLGPTDTGFEHLHVGGRATPRVRGG